MGAPTLGKGATDPPPKGKGNAAAPSTKSKGSAGGKSGDGKGVVEVVKGASATDKGEGGKSDGKKRSKHGGKADAGTGGGGDNNFLAL